MKLVFDWQISASFGWGVFGLNFALELARDPSIEARVSRPIDRRRIGVDALRGRVLEPIIERSNGGPPPGDAAWLQSLGNNFLPERHPQARVGVVFFEAPPSPAALERARQYDFIVTGSSWNEQ